jgi:ABC-type Zn2+ transport system substrate-binding protein/surface adhesin
MTNITVDLPVITKQEVVRILKEIACITENMSEGKGRTWILVELQASQHTEMKVFRKHEQKVAAYWPRSRRTN